MNGNETTGGPAANPARPLVNHRSLAMLRAVAAGRGQVSLSSEPDLFIDGLSCGDQFTAHTLAHQGLMRPERPGLPGALVPAVLTDAGRVIVADAERAAA